MPSKKKKPTLKAAVNRGFATTSIARKVVEAEPDAAADAAPPSDSETPSASASGATTPSGKAANGNSAPLTGRYGFSEEDADEQDLQNLVEKHADKVERDVARFWKIIEFDRRYATSLPTFQLAEDVRDEILQLASFYTRAKLDAQSKRSKNPTADAADEEPDELFPPLPKLNAGAAAFQPRAPQRLSAQASVFTPSAAVTPAVPDWSELEAPPLKEAHEPFDKVLPKALTTRSLLLKMGFTTEHALTALKHTPSLSLDECISYLALRLSADEVDAACKRGSRNAAELPAAGKSSGAAAAAKAARAAAEVDSGDAVSESGAAGSQPPVDPEDESVAPEHPAYSFERRWETIQAPSRQKSDLITSAAALSLNGDGQPAAGAADAKKTERVIKAPSNAAIKIPPFKVRELLRHAKSIAADAAERLDDADSDMDIYSAGPVGAWVSARLAIVNVEKMYGWLKRGLGVQHLMNPLGQGYEAGEALRRMQPRLAGRIAQAERVPHFDPKQAQQVLQGAIKAAEKLSERRTSGLDQWVDYFGEFDAAAAQQAEAEAREAQAAFERDYDASVAGCIKAAGDLMHSDGEGAAEEEHESPPAPAPVEGDGAEEAEPQTHQTNGTAASDTKGKGDEDEDDGAGGMFGDLLDEQPKETQDAATSQIVRLRELPEQAKSGGGGKSPKTILAETLRRIDPQAKIAYAPVMGGGRIYRAELTLRWCGPGSTAPETERKGAAATGARICIDRFRLTGEGCTTQTQAEEMMATLALNCVERDKPVHRLISTAYRDWWHEIEDSRGRGRDTSLRRVISDIRDAILPRLLSAPKEAKAIKAEEGEEQRDLLAHRHRPARTLTDTESKRIATSYEAIRTTETYEKMDAIRKQLPVRHYRERILELLENNQFLVLSAETGAGKSTQVPAYILEDALSKGQRVKIYCTEPRRISAISLAQRVSVELGEDKGQVGTDSSLVGYSVRLESHVGRNAKLVFATTGIALRMLEGDAFDDVTHIIIDEVHERTIESDFLLIILKTLCTVRPDLKVVLMSATIDAERISAYFGGCPALSIPGRTFPVQTYYLEDAIEMSNYMLEDHSPYEKRAHRRSTATNAAKLKSTAAEDDLDSDSDDGEVIGKQTFTKAYSPKTVEIIDRLDDRMVNHELIERLLEHICFESEELSYYSKAVLIFMPGLAEIRTCYDNLTSHGRFGGGDFRIYPLHSTISTEDQSAVFEVPPKGVRKIVIATNIAETGITIPDCTCVIDTGKHREMRFDEKRQISKLVDCFIARSNAKQRRGRAGRVQMGLCFHLFTKLRHDKHIDEHPLPEMLRLSLQDLALKLKVMKVKIGTSIENALSQALDPPSAVNVQRAVASLVDVRALTTLEEITPLGRHLSRLPLDVQLGKFLLIATVYRCLDPALTIAAMAESKSPFLSSFGREAHVDAAKLQFKLADSDFMTMVNVFNAWRRACANNYGRTFCRNNFLSMQILQQIDDLRSQYLTYLIDAGFVFVDDAYRKNMAKSRDSSRARSAFTTTTPPLYNQCSASVAVVNAAAAAGLFPRLISIDQDNFSLKIIGNNQSVAIHPSSVNFKSKLRELPPGVHHLLYFNIMRSRKLYAWQTSAIDDRALVLACGEADAKLSSSNYWIDRKLKFNVPDLRTNVALHLLRKNMARLINSAFKNPGKDWSEANEAFFGIATRLLGFGDESDVELQA